MDTALFTISIQVGSYYDVSIVASGGTFSLSSTTTTLAFGTIQANESQGSDILVKSNISYSLSLISANGGAFLNASDASKLPYSLSVNGSLIALSPGTPTLVANGAQAGYGTPTRYALVATILPYTKLPTQGTYLDTITVNLSAR
jgi:spore coat protein U-like protein